MQDYPDGEFLLPLFPLPNVVFFPQTRIPLHVFEPRYKALISDVLASDERFGIVLLKPGWEADYYGAPPLFEHGTMGVIEQSEALDDGKFNILVRGVVRFRIVELVSSTPYRVARVVAAPERDTALTMASDRRTRLAELSQRFIDALPGDAEVPELASANLESLTNALAMSLQLDATERQRLLEMNDFADRADRLGELLAEKVRTIEFLAPFRRSGDPQMN